MALSDRLHGYPDNIIVRDDRAVGYFTATLRAGVDVVREMLNSDEYRSVHGYDEIPVNMEYPQEGQRYPYVQVMYQNSRFYPSSLEEGNEAIFRDPGSEDYTRSHYNVYLFEGSYVISIYANTILEREKIADCLIGMMGIDNGFRDALYASPYVNVSPNMHTLSSPTSNESVGTPWDADALTCYRQLKFEVRGEFMYKAGAPVTFIERALVDAELVGEES